MRFHASDSKVAFVCLLLCALFFWLDLIAPWSEVSAIYVLIVILSLWSTKPDHTKYLTFLSSFLIILAIFLAPVGKDLLKDFINHSLALFIVWSMMFLGLLYKEGQKTKSYLAAIVDSTMEAVVGRDLENVIISWNKGAELIFGYTAEEAIGRSASILLKEGAVDEQLEILKKIKGGIAFTRFDTMRKRKDNQLIHVSMTISPIKDVYGNIIGASSLARDITKRIQDEQRLKELNNQIELEKTKLEEVLSIEEGLHTIFNIDKLIDFIVEKTTRVLEARRCSLMLVDEDTWELCIKGQVGLDENMIGESRLKIGDPIAGLIAEEGKPVLVTDIETDKRFLRNKRPSYQSKSFVCAPIELNGHLMGVVSVTDKTSKDNNIFSELDLKILCMIVRQVAVAIEAAKIYKELKYLTVTDPLTNMYNYRHFVKSIDNEINRSKRYAGSFCLLMIDIDDFKSYNDTFGHLQGDALLKKVGGVITENVREVDIACRYAGDEFVVILPQTEVKEARIVSEKIRKRIEQLSLKRKVTLSIGIAGFGKDMNRYDFILKADTALYNAKKEGKDTVYVHE